ncbi:hypothetical protein CR513_50916, partial [Mucuna pruriens]
MADSICRRGPSSVGVLPCRLDLIACKWATKTEEPYFYLYETLFLKLGIMLPFTDFEWVALRALNVAPTQLHSISWAFVQAFELLCEDMGKEPPLSFFSLHREDKVGWTSLSSWPRRKLMKPFRESYKQFKDHFFRVATGRTKTNLHFDESGEPLFPIRDLMTILSDLCLHAWRGPYGCPLKSFVLVPGGDLITVLSGLLSSCVEGTLWLSSQVFAFMPGGDLMVVLSNLLSSCLEGTL